MTTPQPPERKPYEPPTIKDLGTLVDLTRGPTSGTPDVTIAGSR